MEFGRKVKCMQSKTKEAPCIKLVTKTIGKSKSSVVTSQQCPPWCNPYCSPLCNPIGAPPCGPVSCNPVK